jgi:hypothetical protein
MTSRPRFYFSPNLTDRANPIFNLELFDRDEESYRTYQMDFQEAFSFCARLSQEIVEIALRNPELRKITAIREIDAEAPAGLDAQQTASRARRGLLARILGRE